MNKEESFNGKTPQQKEKNYLWALIKVYIVFRIYFLGGKFFYFNFHRTNRNNNKTIENDLLGRTESFQVSTPPFPLLFVYALDRNSVSSRDRFFQDFIVISGIFIIY